MAIDLHRRVAPDASAASGTATPARDRRWLALLALCAGQLMIVIDQTIVNVALPSIQQSMRFSQASLSWVVNAYLLTFGGFLLLAGRAGDLFGRRRLLVSGLGVFTAASLACGLAQTRGSLIAARAIQGIGGSIVSAVALALIIPLFPLASERSRALAIWSFASASGGTLGQMAGGVLTQILNWHWIFLVNVPIGIGTVGIALARVPRDGAGADTRLDIPGALSATAAITLAIVAIITRNPARWMSGRTLGELGAAGILLGLFLVIESRTREPLVPLRVFGRSPLAAANLIAALITSALFGWFFLSALYMQRVLGFNALGVGLGYLPVSLVIAAFSLGLSTKIIARFGLKPPLLVGLALLAVGLALFGHAPVGANFGSDLLPAMIPIGLGVALVFPSVMMAAMGTVPTQEAGLASGLVNTCQQLGGALGLTILVSLAAQRTATLSRRPPAEALTSGLHLGFIVAAGVVLVALLVAAVSLRLPGTPGVLDGAENVQDIV